MFDLSSVDVIDSFLLDESDWIANSFSYKNKRSKWRDVVIFFESGKVGVLYGEQFRDHIDEGLQD